MTLNERLTWGMRGTRRWEGARDDEKGEKFIFTVVFIVLLNLTTRTDWNPQVIKKKSARKLQQQF